MIDTPDSIFYPGKHIGRMELKKSFLSSGSEVFNSGLRIYGESGIFSPFPSSDSGLLSSVGSLEETAAPLILTPALQSISYVLAQGPFAGPMPKTLFSWHEMGGKVRRYFKLAGMGMEDKCMRASAFFANAFTRDLDGLDAFGPIELPKHCRESSKVAIQELAQFFMIEETMRERGESDVSWRLEESYAEGKTQEDWVERDRLWAGRIAKLAGLNALVSASKKVEDLSKVTN